MLRLSRWYVTNVVLHRVNESASSSQSQRRKVFIFVMLILLLLLSILAVSFNRRHHINLFAFWIFAKIFHFDWMIVNQSKLCPCGSSTEFFANSWLICYRIKEIWMDWSEKRSHRYCNARMSCNYWHHQSHKSSISSMQFNQIAICTFHSYWLIICMRNHILPITHKVPCGAL